MLFQREILNGVAKGVVTLAFRRWQKPTVKSGGTLTTRVGVLAIGNVDIVDETAITEADARKAGHASKVDLMRVLNRRQEGRLYRIELQLAGEDPRIELRAADSLNPEAISELSAKLQRLDKASRHGPWTKAALSLIARNPGKRAADLAAEMGRVKADFKRDVRKLKAQGLTESLEVGYRLSPRGITFLKSVSRD